MLLVQRSRACPHLAQRSSGSRVVSTPARLWCPIKFAHDRHAQLISEGAACRRFGAPSAAAAAASGTQLLTQRDEDRQDGQFEATAQPSEQAGIEFAFRRCRTLLTALFGVAVWTYLAAGLPSQGPLASLALAMPVSACGSELAMRSAWTGLATGVFHTLCGPDHLAGLTPLSIGRGRVAACALGALWGFGHSTGQLLLGLFFALLKDKFSSLMPALNKWSAYIVPLTVIMIGVMGLHENLEAKPELAAAGVDATPLATAKGKRAGFTTYFTGVVHGLQPDALYVVIPALALPTRLAAVLFITMFVIGTCAAMGGYTLLIGATSKALSKDKPWMQSHLSSAACGVAILCGVLMLLAGQGVNVPFFS